ncbi:MAG: cyclic peptide export ABC transporter [Candidatus Aminicenantes bacterium]|nr:cyclic peptide export ABC transporter [Candidatus Aminicenantes bacterium]
MKKRDIFRLKFPVVFLIFLAVVSSINLSADRKDKEKFFAKIDKDVRALMKKGDIPGLSLVIVEGNEPVYMKGFGYADVKNKLPVTPGTMFELCSCSKAFTALAVQQCREKGLIDLDAPVSKYLPWFYAKYEGKKYPVTLRQLLHHTGGIPFKTIALIPESSAADALQQAVRKLEGIELSEIPGTHYEYATINYDVIGAVIEVVSGKSYEEYMTENILLPLALNNTIVGAQEKQPPAPKAAGYRIGFFSARKYDAPVFRGNTPAGYILSNGKDMARWLQWQMGLIEEETGAALYPAIRETHKRDNSVPPAQHNFTSYGMGWYIHLDGSDLVDHGGLNPNFTTYVGFKPKDKIGVAVLANSNSSYTGAIGRFIIDSLTGEDVEAPDVLLTDSTDKAASVLSFLTALFLLAVVLFLLSIPYDLIKGRRNFAGFSLLRFLKFLAAIIVLLPFLAAIYLVPYAISGVNWKTALVWSPISFYTAVISVLLAMGLCYIGYFLSTLFPQKNKYVRSVPLVVLLSLLAGGANAMIIFLVTSALFSNIELVYQIYYFSLAFLLYIMGRKILQTKLVKITFDIVYDLRMRLVEKTFLTSFQKFEKLDRGRVFATLNDDTGQIGNSANVLVRIITSSITTLGVFAYLATIAFWATVVVLVVIAGIGFLYGAVSDRARIFFEAARDTRNVYMGLLNGLLDGFKELCLQINKKREYKDDLEKSCGEFRDKSSTAIIKFINAFLVGESLLIIVLGSVVFAIPRIFPTISVFTLMSFVMAMLYLIGPINAILNSIPDIVQIRVAWNRVKSFEAAIPANMDAELLEKFQSRPQSVECIKARNILYEYESENQDERFCLGPLDFEAKKGEITFIVGGNGSGKSTLAKVLTGLYIPSQGEISIDGKGHEEGRLGEYFSAVFSNYHLYRKLYNVDLKGRDNEVTGYLETLKLKDKLGIEDNAFSTIDLSGGQRKRLALLQCYLEGAPIYLFDEIAADQDPEFRKFFYRDLLMRMKKEGKIVIAITHDDHYFDVADKIIKMDMGKIEVVEKGRGLQVTK